MPKKKRNSKTNKTRKGIVSTKIQKTLYDAIIIAIKDCLKNNIMSDYLSYHKSEVSEIMKLTWSHKGEIEYEREQAEANGKILGVNLITKMNAWLSKSNRSDELTRSFEDSALQQKLLAEYQKRVCESISVKLIC